MRSFLRRCYHLVERLIPESEHKLMADSQRYWDRVSRSDGDSGMAHWRGQGVFANDDERWLAVGRNNLRIFQRLAGEDWLSRRPMRIVEWGCGGGANAVHFGPGAARYYGIDITQASLEECERQMKAEGLDNFAPVLVEVSNPEQALKLTAKPCDLVISTYVFELIPSKAYGMRILRTVRDLLVPGGLAFIQIKYSDLTHQSYRSNYALHPASMTKYRVEEFWTEATECGFAPQLVYLEPEQPLNHSQRYAYFLLQRP